MKSKEELNKLKEEVEAVNEKLHDLTEEELEQVTGGRVGGPIGEILIVKFGAEKALQGKVSGVEIVQPTGQPGSGAGVGVR